MNDFVYMKSTKEDTSIEGKNKKKFFLAIVFVILILLLSYVYSKNYSRKTTQNPPLIYNRPLITGPVPSPHVPYFLKPTITPIH